MSKTWIHRMSVFAFFLLLGIVCREGHLYAAVIEKVVAVVDGMPITTSDVEMGIRMYGAEIQKEKALSPIELRTRVLARLIDNKVIEAAIKKADIKVDPIEIDRFIDDLILRNGISRERFEEELARRGLDLAEYRKRVEDELRRRKYIEGVVARKVVVTEAELLDYFKKNMDKFFDPSSAEISALFIALPADLKKQDADEVFKMAMEMAREAKKGYALEALASKYGKSYKVELMHLGMVNVKDLNPMLARVAKELAKGEVSEPFVANNGIYIIKVTDRRKASLEDFPLLKDKVHDMVYDIKFKAAADAFVRELRKSSVIEVKGFY
jgi:peptidyl-prolyl cis-trans isomerase SurA